MKLVKFRIHNYKSIIDSGECYPAEMVTILAGKNESGKSSILEALHDFNLGMDISVKSIPIEDDSRKPKISIWFSVSKEEIGKCLVDADIDFEGEISDGLEFLITKTYPRNFTVSSEFQQSLPSDYSSEFIEKIKSTYARLNSDVFKSSLKNLNLPLPNLRVQDSNIYLFKNEFISWKNSITPHISSLTQTTGEVDTQAIIDELAIELSNVVVDSYPQTALGRFTTRVLQLCPNFILFDSFTDVFPNKIPFSELDKNDWVSDLAAVSDLDIEIVKSENDRKKVTHKREINSKVNKDFEQFWTQDLTNLEIDFDNEKLNFWIHENGHYYEPEIRSQGRRWHLAFYIKVSARAKEDADNIILIDEPGLYLHANAQRDILKNLEQCAVKAPVIFSTHSPYLIEPDKLERIRLVQKNEKNGTVVENKIHKVSDKETLTPILTAIGLELNRGIISVDKERNVIVEGISDYYYLNAFLQRLGRDDLHFIHGGSSGNMPKVGTILQGWGCKVLYLYDNDQAFKDAAKNIKSEWTAITKSLLHKLPVDGAIEDMFTPKDFAEHVLGCDLAELTVKNSDYMRKRDKALKAKEFREKITSKPNLELEQLTIDNFKKLLDELDANMKNII
jgi:predicted ATP-dependent endonuclease of OLD family